MENHLFCCGQKRLNCYVLVADDLPTDLKILVLALKTVTHFQVVYQAIDGTEIIAYFKGEPPFDDRSRFPLPHLLILDLKMPVIDGFEVLEWIQAQQLPAFVSVVLTGSENPHDAIRAKALGADAVFTKPVSLVHIREMVGRIERFMETEPKGVTC